MANRNEADWNGEVASRHELREQKRRAALRVAARLFNEKGYHATSLDEIADEIGVTKTALYYYFRNKEELLLECLGLTLACGEDARQEAEGQDGPATREFRTFMMRFLECAVIEEGCYISTPNLRALPRRVQDEVMARRQALQDYVAALLDRAMAEGDLRRIDSRGTAWFLTGAVNWILAYNQEAGGGNVEEIARAFIDNVLYGLARPMPSPARAAG